MAGVHQESEEEDRANGLSRQPVGRPRDVALDEAIILATRRRLARDGYSRMTIGDIASEANVTRPTIYRRWQNKFDLVVEALDYGFRKQADMYDVDLTGLSPEDALREAVRRLDPAYFNPDAITLMSNFAAEAAHTPELMEILKKHSVEPRLALMESVLGHLQDTGDVKEDIDRKMIATMCFGTYFAAFYRGEPKSEIPDRVVAVIWPAIAVEPSRA